MAHWRRWLPLAVAALATALLAGGFGLAVGRLATPRPQPVPQLATVSPATFARLGLRVTAPSLPPYCGVA
ncbi:MAG TPA: hypothetical protein VLW53_00270, partial [Candidatus Eisenbacteria bacterium]|nr:hypothetical protein [Candidatus Eisenbacteria bacterium]